MHYEKANERVPVAPMQPLRPTAIGDYRQNSEIRRTRIIVLILLIIQLIFGLFYFIQRCIDLSNYNKLLPSQREEQAGGSYIGGLVAAVISLIYVIIFIVLVVKYIRTGILVFAWLSLLQLICVLLILITSIIVVIGLSAAAHSVGTGIAASAIMIVIAGLGCLVTILTVIFSFKLAKLLRMQEAYQTV